MIPPDGFRGVFREDAAARGVYAEAAGIARIMPTAVAVPADADDVVTLVRWAAATGTPLIPRGSGSSMAGGAIGAGVIVDLSRLDTIGPIHRAAHSGATITVGPGAIAAQVDRAAATTGLRFPVDPSSAEFCTVGGMAATNAAGAHTLRFGAMRRWVTALDCVFADGARRVVRRGAPWGAATLGGAELESLARGAPLESLAPDAPPESLARGAPPESLAPGAPPESLAPGAPPESLARGAPPESLARGAPPESLTNDPTEFTSFRHAGVRKDSSGYDTSGDLIDLLVGSEGTLALFVGLELALTPLPAATASLLAAFPSLETAVAATHAARDVAVACELLDKTFLDVAESGDTTKRVPPGTEAVLLIELEADTPAAATTAARALATAITHAGATQVDLALDADAEHTLWSLRHAASPILSRLDPSLKSMQFIEDGAVPPDRLAEYVHGVRAALTRHDLRGVIFGHAGDAHIHVNPLIDVRQPDWRRRLDAVLADVTALTARLGGTLTGEHGDGRLRTPLLADVWPPAARDQFARIKHAFDPRGILNPGVKVPLPGQRAVTDVKYDPSLPPLPPTAAAALRRVERDRAYARPRLDLLAEP